MLEFLKFKKTMPEIAIQIFFLLVALGAIAFGVMKITESKDYDYNHGGSAMIRLGYTWIIAGPIGSFIVAQLLLILTSINKKLADKTK